jgi:glycosyltransferase involved in cell wall biosynthesis
MSEQLVIVTPESTPGAGGVGDYTLRLLENLPAPEKIALLVPPIAFDELPTSGGKLLVQYSAYGFDPFGYPRDLIRALIDWKTRTGGRLVLMFHEIWTVWPITNKNFFVQLLHRRAIQRLLEHVDLAFTSTSSQAEHLRALFSRASIRVLPVGSNIRRNVNVDLARQPRTAVLFGRQTARVRALERIQASLQSLAAANRINKIVSVGANSDPRGNERERNLLTALNLRDGFEQRGAQSEQVISQMLLAASFGIFGQDELSYSKSGTFMAYAAHELNVLAEFADWSKPEPFCWLVLPKELLDGISDTELQNRAKELRDWQHRTSSWELIGAQFSEALQLNPSVPAQVNSR